MSFRDVGYRKRADHREVARRLKENRKKMASSGNGDGKVGPGCYAGTMGQTDWAQLGLGGGALAAPACATPATTADTHMMEYRSGTYSAQRQSSENQSSQGQSSQQQSRPDDIGNDARRRRSPRRRKGPPKTQRKTPGCGKGRTNANPPQKLSFSQLAGEIKHFQKLVRELEALVDDTESGTNVEDQWRTRILLRSGEEADDALAEKLEHQRVLASNHVTVQTSLAKLNRDYKRAHDTFHAAVAKYIRKQAVEVSLLSSHDPFAPNRATLQQEEEDYYDRVVREREEDMRKMNAAMHKVNDIYSDLAKLVSEQQGQIDHVEEEMRNSRAYTEVAAENFRRARAKFAACSASLGQESSRRRGLSMISSLNCGGGPKDILSDEEEYDSVISFGSPYGSDGSPTCAEPDAASESEPPWVEPLRMMKDDMVDASHNLMGFGKDFVRSSRAKFVGACTDAPNDDIYYDNYVVSHSGSSSTF
uniref:t-SNARE coiled-coil homology domain-containing protein n=1 Tax=Grammatophora oceanica TaxID=210454 RepID=A0A7S1YGT7_9STRA|mmetsp:Transcript_46189/g.68813  ORF Transcript_46189/g.68813 Transcript_46189/m.68813 type:complete len:476 (+) Transcript_46189:237-1664(+)|eukprot:CAMPEP_0194046684 /NCGR_PEP_ID=MMETSP0009_2-20130614/22243_1 /TAXON_ID=210454 /ORGANISM="Grammatophora oceanica, Strain CCMP 410" /LENGTH=475 /DNA_ID=CAMNT_0038692079 /DNA_START=236 /DNA_END=1663 /DNA_ORIENTATION=-